jgi:hypothetical protein
VTQFVRWTSSADWDLLLLIGLGSGVRIWLGQGEQGRITRGLAVFAYGS